MIDLAQFAGHTPGPWHVENGSGNYARRKGSLGCELLVGGRIIADWHGDGHYFPKTVFPALCFTGNAKHDACNARLIAAAPDLLATVKRQAAQIAQLREALKDVLRIATAASIGVTGNVPRLERARAALAQSEARP